MRIRTKHLVTVHEESRDSDGPVNGRREATGPTGDQAASKGASSGRPDSTVSVSPAACRARPSAIATENAHFASLAIFGE